MSTGDNGEVALTELTAKSAGIGGWTLRSTEPSGIQEYTYQWQGETKKGKKYETTLVWTDGTQYCPGVVKQAGKQAAAFQAHVEKFKVGNIFKFTNITLTTDKKEYIGAPVKYCIDLGKSKATPVLQNPEHPKKPEPPESLASILACKTIQKVDVMAVVQSINAQRTGVTPHGTREIIDVTIIDGSKKSDGTKNVTTDITLFFRNTQEGLADLEAFKKEKGPIALFGLTCCQAEDGKVALSPSFSFRWMTMSDLTAPGSKAVALKDLAPSLVADQNTESISAPDTWQPQEARDFAGETATQTTCALFQCIQQSSEPLPPEGVLFQINSVRIIEPGVGEDLLAEGVRLFPPVRAIDSTSAVSLRMREKAALELTGMDDKEQFTAAVREGELQFPTLASIRIFVRDKAAKKNEDTGAVVEEEEEAKPFGVNRSAVVVEAEEQKLSGNCMPNKAALQVRAMSEKFQGLSSRMLVCKANLIGFLPHIGLVANAQKDKCECVLTLVGVGEKSKMTSYGRGKRLLTKKISAVDFWSDDAGAVEPVPFALTSICAENLANVYQLGPGKPGGTGFYLVVVSGAQVDVATPDSASGAQSPPIKALMVEKAEYIYPEVLVDVKRMLRKMWLVDATSSAEIDTTLPQTPFTAKKTRRLSQTPTDESIGDQQPVNATP